MKENNYDSSIYQQAAQTVIGFHGCDKSVAKEILNSPRKHLIASTNSYDWLGDGIYFWLNDLQRAYEWAWQTHKRKPNIIKEPYVLGAVINLGVCLNFYERNAILLLQKKFQYVRRKFQEIRIEHLK